MKTELIPTIAEVRQCLLEARRRHLSIGCIPTMGALHAGHGTLIDRARSQSDVVVVTLFVNPIQFDRDDDYQRYARQVEADREFCEARQVDVLFAPSPQEMYPQATETFVDVPELARHLCGAFRPGHFRGVATVVAKLLNIVQPDAAYFGQKDAQQLALIRQMVADLNIPVRIVPVPTVRESDGLALSSRNQRLTAEQRRAAPVVFRALTTAQALVAGGETLAAPVRAAALDVLGSQPEARVEYLEVVDSRMQPVDRIAGEARLITAVWFGSTRLIDNVACAPADQQPADDPDAL